MSVDRGERARIPRSPAIALAMLVGICVATCGVPADGGTRGELRGSIIDTPVPKPDLTLTDTNGEVFDLRAETEGYLTLVFFGYTYCPDVCPVHMANLSAVFGDLIPEVRDRIKVVFVSTDPERDTPERLRSWLDNFDRAFVGLRGSLDDINAALSSIQLPGVAVIPGSTGSNRIMICPVCSACEPEPTSRSTSGSGIPSCPKKDAFMDAS